MIDGTAAQCGRSAVQRALRLCLRVEIGERPVGRR
jgi:hypothetical protein